MSLERQRLNGLQDRRLEAGRNWRDGVTPTKPEDIGERARLYKGLAMDAAIASMALEGMSGGRGTAEMVEAQTAQIRGVRREAVLAGFNLGGFDLVVKDKIAVMKAKAEEERLKALEKEGDYKLLRGEFPGVFPEPDSERIDLMGERPVHRNDAGFPAPKLPRRGW